MQNNNQGTIPSRMMLGGILIALGVFFLLEQAFDFRIGRHIWPFYIMGPGVLLFIFALSIDGDSGEGSSAGVGDVLAGIGSVITMTGLLLLYQNTMDHFQSWAYAWALVAPTSIGLGQIVYGVLKERPQTVRYGKNLSMIGIAIFLVGGFFFEFVIGISGFGLGRLGRFAWPILLIGLGAFFILRTQMSRSSVVEAKVVKSPDVKSPVPAESTEPTQKVSGLKEKMERDEMLAAMHREQKAEDLVNL